MLQQQLVNAKVTRVKDGNEGVAMLESGSLDAFASDKIKLIGLAVQAKDPEGARDAAGGPVDRAARVRAAAQRLRVPPRGQHAR